MNKTVIAPKLKDSARNVNIGFAIFGNFIQLARAEPLN
jgi:hypothetical protein